ncbi:MAG TPA: diaminopimelate epimerase [Candidatus Blautia gallistercoris]|uniref:Diaminopimelate epimerase n=1 Tax=Candidatus Blautia gallistercoris TaxID=2838490 RepID=A0A9D1WJW3_9FIRM|nr:diaminopimelate epimerase [Candidatus Blautia gallistercoris]
MKFTKMHGIGNDYVYVNCFQETVENPSETARLVSDRHFGIGSDGLILIKPSETADCCMDMYNADGSQGAMCGNGIRCVAKYVYDYGLVNKEQITVETKSGIKTLNLTIQNGKAVLVEVNMGSPILEASRIPMNTSSSPVVAMPLTIADKTWDITGVSMGNPHAVTYLDTLDELEHLEIEKIGPLFEHHPLFPDRVNTEFVKILDRHTARMRVWERGSGETLACGTGACAVTVASALNGYTDDQVTVQLLGGDLQIRWDRQENNVYMTGPATVVFDGEISL